MYIFEGVLLHFETMFKTKCTKMVIIWTIIDQLRMIL